MNFLTQRAKHPNGKSALPRWRMSVLDSIEKRVKEAKKITIHHFPILANKTEWHFCFRAQESRKYARFRDSQTQGEPDGSPCCLNDQIALAATLSGRLRTS